MGNCSENSSSMELVLSEKAREIFVGGIMPSKTTRENLRGWFLMKTVVITTLLHQPVFENEAGDLIVLVFGTGFCLETTSHMIM